MKKKVIPEPLTESEREELIRLREETEYLRTELAVRKKNGSLETGKRSCATQGEKAVIIKEFDILGIRPSDSTLIVFGKPSKNLITL